MTIIFLPLQFNSMERKKNKCSYVSRFYQGQKWNTADNNVIVFLMYLIFCLFGTELIYRVRQKSRRFKSIRRKYRYFIHKILCKKYRYFLPILTIATFVCATFVSPC